MRLFERTSREVALTAAGERLLVEARDVLRAMDRFEAAVAARARLGERPVADARRSATATAARAG